MSPRGKLLNEQMRAKTSSQIRSAALEVFADYGYHGATMKQMSKTTGYSYGLIYHYYASKEEIFRSLVSSALKNSFLAIQEAINAPGTAWQKIETLSARLVKNAFNN